MRISIIGILIGFSLSATLSAQEQHLTMPPFTYVLDYGSEHINLPEYIEHYAKFPPTLLHLGKDVPFTHNWGPIQALGGENQAYGKNKPYAKEDYIRRLSPDEVKQRIADLTKLTADLHKIGVKWVTSYICSMTIGGHAEKRTGFWEFYDHWDEYRQFGLGDRPPTDPIEWMQRNPDGSLKFFYTFTGPFYPPYEPNIRYAACHNNPDWRYWLEKVTENVAKCGMDGVFVDNAGSLQCYCPVCKKKWRDWIAKRYTEAERKELFGTAEPEMGDRRGYGLFYAETRRFWNSCIAEHLAAIGKAGERITGKPFIVFPNGGEQRPENIMLAFPETDLIMFERSVGPQGTNPGMVLWKVTDEITMKKFNDNIFENKFVQCLRRKVRPIMLTRPGWGGPPDVRKMLEMTPASAQLGCAETAAFGGGGGFLIRPQDEECLKRYRDFFEQHAALYDGLESFAEVGLAVFPEEKYFGNSGHITQIRKATHHLLDGHILFDYVIQDQFTVGNLKKYKVVILAETRCLSDANVAALKEYVESGGKAIVIGKLPELDEKGLKRETPALKDLVDAGKALHMERLPKYDTHLADALQKVLGHPLSIFETESTLVLAKVRVNAFRAPGANRLIMHFLNYNVPLGVDAKEPDPIGPINVAVRLPEGMKDVKPTCLDPQGETVELNGTQEGNVLRFALPELKVYKVVEIK
ncbi:MAG: alpha-amylase family protein [Planctomycetota bacterium]